MLLAPPSMTPFLLTHQPQPPPSRAPGDADRRHWHFPLYHLQLELLNFTPTLPTELVADNQPRPTLLETAAADRRRRPSTTPPSLRPLTPPETAPAPSRPVEPICCPLPQICSRPLPLRVAQSSRSAALCLRSASSSRCHRYQNRWWQLCQRRASAAADGGDSRPT